MQQRDHRSDASGGRFMSGVAVRGDRLPVPTDAVVDPRIGAHGPALLALEDGTVFRGISFGAAVSAGGDLVVNTSQTGYQEICTDPSYAGQVVVMTYPLIGNYGRIAGDDQSARPWLSALVVAHATAAVLEPALQLVTLLRDTAVPAICGLDTRLLARTLRSTGSQRAYITAPGMVDGAVAVDAARRLPRWEEQDFVRRVSAAEPYEIGPADAPLVALVDYG
ncbi:MAG TPA: carbamoyl-phosphate synthase domain-containing protein, partial [Candidatus Caenarcaniphilales bacterium]|nr:carbamoyl-phosphate synthase domain-containing protein [Candidatus Caenarcaniphilales bacterium]